jgi:hypothetical protein
MCVFFSDGFSIHLQALHRTPNRAISLATKRGSVATTATGITAVGVAPGTRAAIHRRRRGRRRRW